MTTLLTFPNHLATVPKTTKHNYGLLIHGGRIWTYLPFPLAAADLGKDCVSYFNRITVFIFDLAWHDFFFSNNTLEETAVLMLNLHRDCVLRIVRNWNGGVLKSSCLGKTSLGLPHSNHGIGAQVLAHWLAKRSPDCSSPYPLFWLTCSWNWSNSAGGSWW